MISQDQPPPQSVSHHSSGPVQSIIHVNKVTNMVSPYHQAKRLLKPKLHECDMSSANKPKDNRFIHIRMKQRGYRLH